MGQCGYCSLACYYLIPFTPRNIPQKICRSVAMHILIIDDHQLFIDGLSGVLNNLNQQTSIHSANSIPRAQSLLEELELLDLILLDLNLHGLDGISFLKHLETRVSTAPIIVVSATDDILEIKQAMDHGARGFIPKSYSSSGMLSVIQSVLAGEIYLPFGIKEKIAKLDQEAHHSLSALSKSLKDLRISRRQYNVLELLARGDSNSQIAKKLSLSEHTIKSHVNRLFKALNVKNRVDCTLEAIRMGIVSR